MVVRWMILLTSTERFVGVVLCGNKLAGLTLERDWPMRLPPGLTELRDWPMRLPGLTLLRDWLCKLAGLMLLLRDWVGYSGGVEDALGVIDNPLGGVYIGGGKNGDSCPPSPPPTDDLPPKWDDC